MKFKQLAAGLLCAALVIPGYAAEQLENLEADSGKSIRIAFLDSGVSCKHLNAAQVEEGQNYVFPNQDTDDNIGHGTATAGLVLGSEELALTGLCPSAVIVPLVCYDAYPTGVTAPADVTVLAQALRDAVDLYHCQIINISMGTTQDDPELCAAVAYVREQGALVISAVGNDQISHPEYSYYPAAYEGVIGVGAADGAQTAAFSQRNHVDVLAPGVDLQTVTRRNSAQTESRSGTSYACAYITGICAALWTAQPTLTAQQIQAQLYALAQDIGEIGFDGDSGWGVVTKEGLLDPDGTVTRAALATALYQWAGMPDNTATATFSDVAADQWYTDAIGWVASVGLMCGYGNGQFGTDDLLTGEQVLLVLQRWNKLWQAETNLPQEIAAIVSATPCTKEQVAQLFSGLTQCS